MSSSLPPPSPSLPVPLPSPSPSIRPSKLELLRLLREQREQQLQAVSTQPTPSLASTSDTTTSNPSSAASSTSSSSHVNMGAILGGLAGGLFVLALILVAIIVPLQRRRRLRSSLTSGVAGGAAAKTRRRINLDLPFGLGREGDAEKGQDVQGDKERESMIAGKIYPTARTHRTTGSQAPLLGEDRAESAPSSPKRSAFGERGGSIGLEELREARYPVQSSTHLYQEQKPTSGIPLDGTQPSRLPPEEGRKQPAGKHDDLWFYYRTNSTAAPPISNSSTVSEQAVPEFDPYSPFEGTRSPLEERFPDTPQPIKNAVELERPAPAAAPSSPKKQSRDLPLPDTTPFLEVDLNDAINSLNVSGTSTVGPRIFDTGKSSVDIYTCIDNPFMTSFERNQPKPPAVAGATAQAPTAGVNAAGASWFSYHSSSARSGPNSRAPPLPPTFIPPSSTVPSDARNPKHQTSLDSVSDTDSESMYSQMSLSRSTTAMSVNGSIIRYGSARAHVAGNGGSGFMPVVHEAKEDAPLSLKEASLPASATLDAATEPPSPSTTKEEGAPWSKATPAEPNPSNNGAGLNRLDTFAIGNLLKTRANKVAVQRSDSVVEQIERKGSILEAGSGAGVRRQDSALENEEVVVRGRGVRRERVKEDGENRRIARAPVKRSASLDGGRSRSESRGRLVPKASIHRLRAASSDEGGISGGSEEGGFAPSKPPIGRSPSKYKPKALEQRLVEKGLLNGPVVGGRSRSASRDVDERVRAPVGAVEKVNRPTKGESEPSSVVPAPLPSPAKGKTKNGRNAPARKTPPSSLDSSLLSAPPELNKAPEGFAGNPLTGAFGLGHSPSARSPATPTFQYAAAELDRAKGFLPKVEGLKVGGSPGKKKSGK